MLIKVFRSKDAILQIEQDLFEIEPNSLILISNRSYETINYQDEICGKTNRIKMLTNYSKQKNCTIFFACKFDLFERISYSVLACANGKILGIADESQIDRENNELKIFKLPQLNVGLIVGKDLFNLKNANLLNKFGANLFVNFADENISQRLMSYVYVNGNLFNKSILCVNNNSSVLLKKQRFKTDLILESNFDIELV